MINRLRGSFTIVDNTILNSKELSLKAKGLYAFMCSKPDDWKFSYAGLKSQLQEGEKAIRTAIKELVEYGVLLRVPIKENGKFTGWDWIIHPTEEDKKLTIDPLQNGQNRKCPKWEVPEMGTSQNGEEINNTNLSNTNLSKNKNNNIIINNNIAAELQQEKNALETEENFLETSTLKKEEKEKITPPVPPTPPKKEKEYGNPEVNELLSIMKKYTPGGILEGSQKEQRFYGAHLVNKLKKLDLVVGGQYTWQQVLEGLLGIIKNNQYHSHKIVGPKKLFYNLVGLLSVAHNEIQKKKDDDIVF